MADVSLTLLADGGGGGYYMAGQRGGARTQDDRGHLLYNIDLTPALAITSWEGQPAT